MDDHPPGRVRSRTISAWSRRTDEPMVPYPEDVERPRTRGDCYEMPRPCPFVSCRWHLALDVSPQGGIKLNFPNVEIWEMEETCALDLADRGGMTLEEVGAKVNVTRERIRQLEFYTLKKLPRKARELLKGVG